MSNHKGLRGFLQSEKSEHGAMLVVQAFFMIFLIFFTALLVDGGLLYWKRRELQKVADVACTNAAIAINLGLNPNVTGKDTIAAHDVPEEFYSTKDGENEGTGIDLIRGVEVSDDGEYVRVALYGRVKTYFVQFVPGVGDNLHMGANAKCEKGIGGPAPLILEEMVNDEDLIFETKKPNDHWSGPCPDQVSTPNPDYAERNPPYCWVWGVDMQILAGDGHKANEGTVSMNGLIAPDVRCEGAPSESNKCSTKIYLPPAEEGAVNPLKGLTKEYMCGGYNGYEPYPGTYTGVHSANIAQLEGVSNAQLVKAIVECYGYNKLIAFYVYGGGKVWDGNKNYDYVEEIGLTIGRIVYIDANTVGVIPIYPPKNLGDPTTLRDDLPKTVAELEARSGYNLKPKIVEWLP